MAGLYGCAPGDGDCEYRRRRIEDQNTLQDQARNVIAQRKQQNLEYYKQEHPISSRFYIPSKYRY